jgi:cytochrome c-type biogenesis protein CcmH/NrfF
VDRYAERNPGMVDQSDAAIAREMLKIVRRSIEQHGGP